MMLILSGNSALSQFRREKLVRKLEVKLESAVDVSAQYMHFVATSAELNEQELLVLNALLEYGSTEDAVSSRGELLLSVPRAGTISPWSSKATDIAHNCGLEKIIRIERGIAFYVNHQSTKANAKELIVADVHDRHG